MPPPRNDIRNDTQPSLAPAPAHPQPASPPHNDIRNDIGATATCPVCQTAFIPTRRQRYCTPACRQAAWRRRHPAAAAAAHLPPPRPARQHTIYECGECGECGTRYAGQQWCPDCTRPCRRIGPGGPCPHCDEPVAITDLISPM